MANPYTYFYRGKIRSHLKQILRIFSGIQVEYGVDRDGDGEKDRRTCSLHYGDMDRVVATVLHKEGSFIGTKLPVISGYLTSIEFNPEEKRSKFHTENVARIRETDGVRISDSKLMGVPYKGTVDLSIYASNSDQMYQLLEQILLLFNPRLSFQTTDNLIDWNYITEAELVGFSPEQNIPAGPDERMIVNTLTFTFTFWLDFPMVERTSIINQIFLNIKDNGITPVGIDVETVIIDENT